MQFSRRCFCGGATISLLVSTGSKAVFADDYPFVVGSHKALRPVCGNSLWSISDQAGFVDLSPPPELIKCLQAVSGVMGIKPSVGMIGDANNPILQVDKIDDKNDGIVCLNDLMLKKVLGQQSFALEILTGLLSHEFCHVYQLRNDCMIDFNNIESMGLKRRQCFANLVLKDGSKKFLELHSDFMAGWTLARLNLLTTATFGGFAKEIFADGDYYYNDNDHHGTPRERLNAMADGFLFGRTGDVLGYYASQYLKILKHSPRRSSPASAFLVGQATLAARKY
jgi:hypothetical protein